MDGGRSPAEIQAGDCSDVSRRLVGGTVVGDMGTATDAFDYAIETIIAGGCVKESWIARAQCGSVCVTYGLFYFSPTKLLAEERCDSLRSIVQPCKKDCDIGISNYWFSCTRLHAD